MKRPLLAAAAASAILATTAGTAFATANPTSQRLAGADRYGTAHAIATQNAWAPGGKDVVIANGENYSDALAAATLGAPVVLTTAASLPTESAKALDELKATRTNVKIVGGTASVNEAVANEARAKGYTVQRLAGADRVATAAAVAREHATVPIGTKSSVIVVTSRGFTDALAAAPTGLPILLTEKDSVPSATLQMLKDREIQNVIVVGGTNAISDKTVETLGQDGRTTSRIAGPNAAATAAAVADWESFILGWKPANVILASSLLFPDGLAGGALGAALKAPVLMAGFGLPSETKAIIEKNKATVDKVIGLGGTRSVDDAAMADAVAAAKG